MAPWLIPLMAIEGSESVVTSREGRGLQVLLREVNMVMITWFKNKEGNVLE